MSASISRKFLADFRSVQFWICGRRMTGAVTPGRPCHVESFRSEENHGDIVHPCVRYIPEGYEGHKWWMVYTPYYGANAALENPILCFAEDNSSLPPKEWKVYCEVNEKPEKGYNSDPTLLYKDGQLFVFWRENESEKCFAQGYCRATFGGLVKDGKIEKWPQALVYTADDEEDAETCPTFMPGKDGKVLCYAMHLTFHSKRIKRMGTLARKMVNRIVLVTDLLGFYSQQKSHGYSIWYETDGVQKPFKYIKTLRFGNCNRLWRPWHMDFFDYDDRRYAIVQTNMCNADLALAWSDDGETFTFYKRPLITNQSIGMAGIYKPCAGVTHDGLFYLYYTAQSKQDRRLNRLFLTTIPFSELIEKLR